MPVSPTPDDAYYFEIAQAYQQAELDILTQIKDRLARGVTLTDQEWATSRLAETQVMRRETTAQLAKVNRSMASSINGSFGSAYKDGEVAALKDATAYLPGKPTAVSSDSRRRSVEAIARENTARTAQTMGGILRQAEDDYRSTVADVVRRTAAGSVDRRTATDRALKASFGKGLMTGPPNSRGVRMSLPDYITMSTRTGVAKSMIAGHLDSLGANGVDLVFISPGPRHCELCDDWANVALHRVSGPRGLMFVDSVTEDKQVGVHVLGSLDDARNAGWGHPNCRCSVGGYFPGATEKDLPKPRPKWDEKGYLAQQDQRRLERQIRDAKLRAALSTDPDEKSKAEREVRLNQAHLRAHLDAHPELKRQPRREALPPTSGGSTPTRTPRTPPKPRETPPKVTETPPKPKTARPFDLDEVTTSKVASERYSEAAQKSGSRANELRQAGKTDGPEIWDDEVYKYWNDHRQAWRDKMNTLASEERQVKLAAAKARKAEKAAAAKIAGQFDPDNPLKIYGNRLVDESNDRITAKWKEDMREGMTPTQHKVLAKFFQGTPDGGVYLGGTGKAVPHLDKMQHLANVRPRGYPAGMTWSDSGGAYVPNGRKVIVGDPKRSGSASTVLHESSHALDRAYQELLKLKGLTGERVQELTQSKEFRTMTSRWQDSTRNGGQEIDFNAYYSNKGNPSGWQSEIWAEGGARLMEARMMDRDPVRAVADGLGMNRMSANGQIRYTADNDPGIRKAAQEFIDYWDKLEASVTKEIQ